MIRFKIGQSFKGFLLIMVLGVFLAANYSLPVMANSLTPEQIKAFQSGIYYYDTEIGGGAACAAAGVALSGSDNKIKIWYYLVGKGLTPPQAAGIMGNIDAESKFDPAAEQTPGAWSDMSGAYHRAVGIVQWDGGRRVKLINTAQTKNIDPKDLGYQLDFMFQEATDRGDWEKIKQATTASDAAFLWHKWFEISNDGPERIQGRINVANAILAELGSMSGAAIVATGGTATSSSGCASGVSSKAAAIVQAAVLYSWPEKGHGLTPKPEYAAAVAQFHPGAPFRGADCGAFVATVMRATGADPNYHLVGTIDQEAYVKQHPELFDVNENVKDVSELLPGDIMIVNTGNRGDMGSGHTYIYVGPQGQSGFDRADASGGSRMPNLGKAEIQDSLGRGNYIRVRLK